MSSSSKNVIIKISGRKTELPSTSQLDAAQSGTPQVGPAHGASGSDLKGSILDVERRPGGAFLITHPDGRRERAYGLSRGTKFTTSLSGRLYFGERLIPERGGSASGGAGDSDLTAQFPGKVRKVLVASGVTVTEGQPLLLLEAMKMEFAIKAPSDGTVLRVLVKEGEQLSPGVKLVDFQGKEE
jgi:biotin carboxyl carrier protein